MAFQSQPFDFHGWGAVLSLFSSIYAADTVYLALVSIAGFAVVVVWLSIPMAQINFRKQWKLEHSEDELDYKTPFNPILPYIHNCSVGYFCAWDCLG